MLARILSFLTNLFPRREAPLTVEELEPFAVGAFGAVVLATVWSAALEVVYTLALSHLHKHLYQFRDMMLGVDQLGEHAVLQDHIAGVRIQSTCVVVDDGFDDILAQQLLFVSCT